MLPLNCVLYFMSVLCFSSGFLPSYLLPAYEEVGDLPVMPPPPYTPQSPPPPTDPAEECPCLPSVVSVPSGTDAALPACPELLQSHSAYSPNKDLTPGRYRRFTGDSGIEVCDGQDLLEQHGFIEREEETEEEGTGPVEDPYDHCEDSHISNGDFNEHTGGHTAVSTEPQSLR